LGFSGVSSFVSDDILKKLAGFMQATGIIKRDGELSGFKFAGIVGYFDNSQPA